MRYFAVFILAISLTGCFVSSDPVQYKYVLVTLERIDERLLLDRNENVYTRHASYIYVDDHGVERSLPYALNGVTTIGSKHSFTIVK
jgi:hypothetical protein